MQLKRIVLIIALLSGAAVAQTTSTITGTIKDLTGALVTSGKITFTLRPGTDATMSGLARFTGQTVTCLINASGLVKAQDGVSACVITMNTALQPAGSGYLVSFWPGNVKTATIFMYALVSSIDITTVVSTQAQLPNQGGVVDVFTNQTIGGNKTFSGTVTLSNALALASPTITGTDNGTETLQNKTLQSPTSTGTDSGAETLVNKSLTSPTSTGTDNGTETLGNKSLTSPALTTPTIGGETITASPRITFSCFKQAASGAAATADCFWTPDKNITVTRFQVGNMTAPVGCGTVPQFGVVLLSGPTTVVALNLPNGAVNADSGAISVNLAAGSAYQIGQTQADVGCGSHAGPGNMTIQYKMQ